MSEESRYALWLVPGGETYDDLSALIRRLAKSHAAPVFEPHLTLLGTIATDDAENALRRTIAKFIKRFRHIEMRASEEGRELRDMSLEEMEQHWQESKGSR